MIANHIKYPRTRHLPWSPGVSSDDLKASGTEPFVGKRVIRLGAG